MSFLTNWVPNSIDVIPSLQKIDRGFVIRLIALVPAIALCSFAGNCDLGESHGHNGSNRLPHVLPENVKVSSMENSRQSSL